MVIAAVLLAGWPFVKSQRWAGIGIVTVLVVAGVVALYPLASNYAPRSAAFEAVLAAETREALVAATAELSEELKASPDDYIGWRVLGNGRLLLREYPEAIAAFRQAMSRATGPDPGLMMMLGEALQGGAGGRMSPEAAELYVGAFRLTPEDPNAMFSAGLGYAAQGRTKEAADVWELLLSSTTPPDDVAEPVRRQIAAWRAEVATSSEPIGTQLTLRVKLADALADEFPESARLYVSVRDPAQPGPPLAARQLAPQDLPVEVGLSDADAMIAGRNLSSASAFAVTARISMSGDPVGGPGDYVGTLMLDAVDDDPLDLLIDRIVAQ